MRPHDPKRCYRCGAVRAEAHETVPYVGPGPRVVQLRDVLVVRCTGCPNLTVELPALMGLDTLIERLGIDTRDPLPQLAHEQGCWSVLPRRRRKTVTMEER